MPPFDLPVREALRLPGQTAIAWAVFDAIWYRLSYPDSIAALADRSDEAVLAYYFEFGQKLGHSPNRFFDEVWYRRAYRDIRAVVEAGHNESAFDAYCRGGNIDRSPHWLFDEPYYRLRHPDLTGEALLAGGFVNGYDHYLRCGGREGRIGHFMFDPEIYLAQMEPEEQRQAAMEGPFQYYLACMERGETERATCLYFDMVWYKMRYPDVTAAIAQGQWRYALEHYLCNETPTDYDPLPDFSEAWYLQQDPQFQEVLDAGEFRSGYAHFLLHGTTELRSPAPHIDLRWYAARDNVRADIARGAATDVFSHWLAIGRPGGDPAATPPDEQITETQARALFLRYAESLMPLYGRSPLTFSCNEKPAISVVAVMSGRLAEGLATLVSIRNNTKYDIELILVTLGTQAGVSGIGRFVTGAAKYGFDTEIGVNAAYEAGLSCAQADAVLLAWPGVEYAPGAIDAALRRLRSDPRIGAVGGKVLRSHGVLANAGCVVWSDGGTEAYLRDASPIVPEANFVRDVHFCSSAFLLVRRDLLTELGGLDVTLATGDTQAADVCVRLAEAGYRIVYDPAVMVRQWGGERTPDNPVIRPDRHAAFLARCMVRDRDSPASARMADASRRRLLFIEDTVPLRGFGSGFVRSNDLIQAIDAIGYAVTVFPVNGCEPDLGGIFAEMPPGVEVMHDRTLSRLTEFLAWRRGYFDIIWIARTHNLARVLPILKRFLISGEAPSAIVLDTEAVSAMRDAGKAALEGRTFDLPKAMRIEFRDAARCRTIVAVNAEEAGALRELGFPDVRVIGHARALHPTPRSFGQRAGLLFVGAIHGLDSPNFDSLCWLIDKVLPLVERVLGWETRLTIAGYTGQDVDLDRFRAHPRVTLRGAVADLTPLYASHRVFVAPTRFAAGVPYKVHEAASFGLPVVATDLLCRQLGWTSGTELLAADTADPAEFAAGIVALYRDAALWTRLRDAALVRLRRDNDPDAYATAVRDALESASSDRSDSGLRGSRQSHGLAHNGTI